MTDATDRLPQFVIAGAPKAGTTALHAALATHPGLYLSPVKEPKYYLTDGRPPPRSGQRGPGDAHSAREWIWRREDYLALFDGAPAGTVRGESTPFYLYDRAAQARLAADVPGVKVIVVVRDPVDRAYSNWAHLRADGLEPEADFAAAVRARGPADRRRLGAVLALPRAGPVRRAAARPVRARPAGPGVPAALPPARGHPAGDPRPGQRVPRRAAPAWRTPWRRRT